MNNIKDIWGPYIDENGTPVKRSKQSFPYNYDSFVQWRGGTNEEINGSCYSDRLLQWNYEKCRTLMQKHFGESGDYFSRRKPEAIESFLREYFEDDSLRLILIMEHCNQSTGYPLWSFEYHTKK